MEKKVYKKLAKLSNELGICKNKDSKEIKAKLFISWIKNLNKSMGIPLKLDIEFNQNDVDEMINFAMKEANPLYPVPKEFSRKEFLTLYHCILK